MATAEDHTGRSSEQEHKARRGTMKIRMLNTRWKREKDGLRCRLDLGQKRGKCDEAFIPVHPNTPMGGPFYIVLSSGEDRVLYAGPDEERARRIGRQRVTQIFLAGEDHFQVVRADDEKGTVLIRRGEDKTDRVLLFVGCDAPTRGRVSVFDEETTGNIVVKCKARNQRDERVELAVILRPNQTIAFHRWGGAQDTNEVVIYSWNGTVVCERTVGYQAWQTTQKVDTLAAGSVEVL